MRDFKDFYIKVGEAGAWSRNMDYDQPFGVYNEFGIMVKHAPFSMMSKIKNVVVQSWPDEHGDDVYLPKNADGTPSMVREAVDYEVQFVYHRQSNDDAWSDCANRAIKNLIDRIQGRWLQIYDEYTGIGYDCVYLQDVDDDPKFRRRGYDTVIFTLTFKINGEPIESPFV